MYIFFWFPGEELDEWIKVQNWTIKEDGKVFVSNQEAHIKSKNIAEKIDLDSELWWIIDSLEQMYQYSNIVDKAPSNFDFIRYIFPDKTVRLVVIVRRGCYRDAMFCTWFFFKMLIKIDPNEQLVL